MSYAVINVTDTTVEIWDRVSYREQKHRTRATMTLQVGRDHQFRVDDIVDLKVVLLGTKENIG